MHRDPARFLGDRGFEVWATLPPVSALPQAPELADWVDVLEERIRSARMVVRTLQESSDERCLVVAGMSFGAIVALAAANLEDDVDGLVLMLGGGDLEQMAGRLPELGSRYSAVSVSGASPELRDRLSRVDPTIRPPRLPPSSILQIDATFDAVVPASSATKLWESLGYPERRQYPTGHFSFGLALPLALGALADHADRVWASERR